MGMSSGGGPELMSTLTGPQKKVAKQLSKLLRKEIANPTRNTTSLFGEDQLETLNNLFDKLDGVESKGNQMGVEDALKQLLNPDSSAKQVSQDASKKAFMEGIANPMARLFSEKLAPEIRRGFQGFSSRSGRAVTQSAEKLQQDLMGKMAIMELERQKLNANVALQADAHERNSRIAGLGLAPGILNRGVDAAKTKLTLQEAKNNKIYAEAERNLPINNKAIAYGLGFTGQSHGQIVDMPAESTAFGTALQAGAAIATGGASLAVPGGMPGSTPG